MSDNREVLSAIGSLKELVEEKHNHLETQLGQSQKDIARNQGSIEKLYSLDRKQSGEIADNNKERIEGEGKAAAERAEMRQEFQPVIHAAKTMRKGMWTMLGAFLATIGAGVGAWVLKVFERGGGA